MSEKTTAEKKKEKKKKVDPHIGCYSYPNCDIDPSGCRLAWEDDVEEFGYKD